MTSKGRNKCSDADAVNVCRDKDIGEPKDKAIDLAVNLDCDHYLHLIKQSWWVGKSRGRHFGHLSEEVLQTWPTGRKPLVRPRTCWKNPISQLAQKSPGGQGRWTCVDLCSDCCPCDLDWLHRGQAANPSRDSHRDSQPFTLAPVINLEQSINLIGMFLDCRTNLQTKRNMKSPLRKAPDGI